ncbi:MAG: efflux RND transporter periplasmic adaptor subunit [Paracoccaceae bacterium]
MRIFSVAVAIIVLTAFYLFTFERDLLNEFAISNFSDTSEKLTLQTGEQALNKKTDIDQTSFSVVVKKSDAKSLNNLIILRGRSEAVRQVSVKSQTTGLIISEPLPKGSKIIKNQVLCEIDPGIRLINLKDVRSRLAEAVARMPESDSRVIEAEAKLDEAIARTPAVMSRVLEAEAKLNEALSRKPEANSRLTETKAALSQTKARVPESDSRVAEAKARLVEANINYNAAIKLKAGGYASETRLASNEALQKQARANLETAKAGVEATKASIKSAMANIETAKAGIEATKTKIKSAMVNIETAKADVEANKAKIKSAKANIETAKAGVETTKSRIKSAQAAVATAMEEVKRLKIRAPFSGYLETNTAELGSLMQPGSLCATIVDLSTIKLVGFVPENVVSQIKSGAPSKGITSAGQKVEGAVSFISKSADPATRTFRLEVTVPNSKEIISDGQTVEITVGSEGKSAHLLPASSLTLDTNGEMGVRVVSKLKSKFKKVLILKDTTSGVWVSGLNEKENVIVVGQEYLTDDMIIIPSYLKD